MRTIATAAVLMTLLLAPQTGSSGAMAGIVVGQGGTGVPGVEVRAAGDDGSRLLTSRTDADGRFTFTRVPAGRWLLTATAEGYLPGTYGAFASGQPGVPVRIEAGSAVADLGIALERPATIAGGVVNADGASIPSAVHAMTVSWTGAEQSLRRVATATTDAGGRYAIGGLSPGSYLILATPFAVGRAAQPQGEVDAAVYRAGFYPAARAAVHAAVVTVSAGEEAFGVDVTVDRAPSAPLTVTLTRNGRAPLGYVAGILLSPDIGDVGMQVDSSPTIRPLVFSHVSVGQYELIGSALDAAPDGRLERLWATGTIGHDGRTPVEVSLELAAGAVLEGRLVFEGVASPVVNLPESWLWPVSSARPDGVLPFAGTLQAMPSGAFAITGIAPGRYVLQFGRDASAQPAGWSVTTVMMQGQDVADLPIDVRAGDRYTDAEVTLSNRQSVLQGTLADQGGRGRFDVTLVVFPADSRYWWTGTRRIRLARPDTSGFYLMRGLPAGEYLLAAVSGALPPDVTEPQWLSGLTGAAVRVLVSAGGRTVQDLRIARDVRPAAVDAGTPATPGRRWPRP